MDEAIADSIVTDMIIEDSIRASISEKAKDVEPDAMEIDPPSQPLPPLTQYSSFSLILVSSARIFIPLACSFVGFFK